MGLSGTYVHQLDGKNRIRIPKRLRAKLPENEAIYFVKYEGGCVAVFTESVLDQRIEAFGPIRSNQPELLRQKRALMRAIVEVEEDDQHRTLFPAALREYAGIKKDVVSVGMGDYIEIWAAERFAEQPDDPMQYPEAPIEDALHNLAF